MQLAETPLLLFNFKMNPFKPLTFLTFLCLKLPVFYCIIPQWSFNISIVPSKLNSSSTKTFFPHNYDSVIKKTRSKPGKCVDRVCYLFDSLLLTHAVFSFSRGPVQTLIYIFTAVTFQDHFQKTETGLWPVLDRTV